MRARTDTSPWNWKRNKQLCVTAPPEMLAAIDDAAKREKITRSQWVRERLEWALEGHDDYADA